jgi:hypothetical protein
MDGKAHQVISLQLTCAEDMFQVPQSDLFSEYRNFLTGVDYSISELRSRRSRAPVRLELAMPSTEVDHRTVEQIGSTLRRYCDHRIAYNKRERRAVRYDGVWSLRIGLPITILGLIAVVNTVSLTGQQGNFNLAFDTLGWVLVWVGLWFPLDTLLFSPLAYGRENRSLLLLRDAEIVVEPRQLDPTPGPIPPT